MKRLLLTGFLAVALARGAAGQVAAYTNSSSLVTSFPPNIDATNFVNKALFELTISSLIQFDFSDVLNYTNTSIMYCTTGFRFDNTTTAFGRRPAANFFNGNGAQVLAGLPDNEPAFTEEGEAFLPEIVINATNVTSTGTFETDPSGVINITGSALNLARSTLHVDGFDATPPNDLLGGVTNLTDDLGIFSDFHGFGRQTNLLSVLNFTLPSPFSPLSNFTNNLGAIGAIEISPFNATPYVNAFQLNASNISWQVVFINTNLPGIGTDVRFQPTFGDFSIPTVQWSAVITNSAGVSVATNFIYLQDQYGAFPTNFLVTNSFSLSGAPQLAPYNYTFTRTFPGFTNLPTANTAPYTTAIFGPAFPATNAYSVYEVSVQPTGFTPDPTAAASSITNLPGRIHLTATNTGSWLDLTRATVNGANYVTFSATNHFVGSAGATIVAPNMDINLGSTNGNMTISGLVAPSVPRFSGLIDVYSARWTNVTAGFTNEYHVLIVNSGLTPSAPVVVQNFDLRSTNVTISDIVSITNGMLINAQNLTLTTNGATAPNPTGELVLLNNNISWSTSVPNLQNFTNSGLIDGAFNAELGNSLDFFDANGAPYKSWVNHGTIIGGEITVNANYLENSGIGPAFFGFGGQAFTNEANATIETSGGDITLQAATAVLLNGQINAEAIFGSDQNLNLTAGNLVISNQALQVLGTLTLVVTNNVMDGGGTSSNQWLVTDGINLALRPKTGDFLGTTVTLTASANEEVDNTWDGQDLGASPAGFVNNGALGHLILDAADANGTFLFQGLDAVNPYALYVDQIELQGGATNGQIQNGTQVFTAFDLPTNMTIYFADAISSGHDISEKLNGAFGLDGTAGGKLVWVPSFAGIFSSTSITYPNGITYQFNRALKASDIESNGKTPNFATQFPFNVNLSVVRSNKPPPVSVLSWYAPSGSTNQLLVRTNLASTNWLTVTNFVQGIGAGEVTVNDVGRTNGANFYKVLINPAQP